MKINLIFFYDKENRVFQKRIEELKEYIETKEELKQCRIYDQIRKNMKKDLYIMIADHISVIRHYIDENKIRNYQKIIIITENKDIYHIIECINITRNMYYLFSSNEYLTNKFLEADKKNKSKI